MDDKQQLFNIMTVFDGFYSGDGAEELLDTGGFEMKLNLKDIKSLKFYKVSPINMAGTSAETYLDTLSTAYLMLVKSMLEHEKSEGKETTWLVATDLYQRGMIARQELVGTCLFDLDMEHYDYEFYTVVAEYQFNEDDSPLNFFEGFFGLGIESDYDEESGERAFQLVDMLSNPLVTINDSGSLEPFKGTSYDNSETDRFYGSKLAIAKVLASLLTGEDSEYMLNTTPSKVLLGLDVRSTSWSPTAARVMYNLAHLYNEKGTTHGLQSKDAFMKLREAMLATTTGNVASAADVVSNEGLTPPVLLHDAETNIESYLDWTEQYLLEKEDSDVGLSDKDKELNDRLDKFIENSWGTEEDYYEKEYLLALDCTAFCGPQKESGEYYSLGMHALFHRWFSSKSVSPFYLINFLDRMDAAGVKNLDVTKADATESEPTSYVLSFQHEDSKELEQMTLFPTNNLPEHVIEVVMPDILSGGKATDQLV